jgi:hypothetical protein
MNLSVKKVRNNVDAEELDFKYTRSNLLDDSVVRFRA